MAKTTRHRVTQILILSLLATTGVILVSNGSGVTTKVSGPQLISVQPLPDDGVFCESPGENGGSTLAAAMEQQRAQMQLASLIAAPQQQVASSPPPPANAA